MIEILADGWHLEEGGMTIKAEKYTRFDDGLGPRTDPRAARNHQGHGGSPDLWVAAEATPDGVLPGSWPTCVANRSLEARGLPGKVVITLDTDPIPR